MIDNRLCPMKRCRWTAQIGGTRSIDFVITQLLQANTGASELAELSRGLTPAGERSWYRKDVEELVRVWVINFTNPRGNGHSAAYRHVGFKTAFLSACNIRDRRIVTLPVRAITLELKDSVFCDDDQISFGLITIWCSL